MPLVHQVSHPIVADKIRLIRSQETVQADFVRLVGEVTRFVTYEAFRDAATESVLIDTPVVSGVSAVRVATSYLIVPILRAGLGMSPAVQEVLPQHRVCVVGLRRNEVTLQPDVYYDGLPADVSQESIVICDPMLATGGSLCCVLDMLTQRGAREITVLSVLAAQPGIDRVHARFPDVRIFCAALDPILNEAGYIVPGLGDAGDRLFGDPVR